MDGLTITQISGTVSADDAPGYGVVRLPQPRTILLDADAPSWHDAIAIEWGPDPYRTRFRACWDPIAARALRCPRQRPVAHDDHPRRSHLWEEEVVEIFLDLDGSGRNYAELEISPINVVCDLRERAGPSLASVTEWDWEGMTSAVSPLRDRAGGVEGWTALARLPWTGLAVPLPRRHGFPPPQPGQACLFNVFRIKRPAARAGHTTGSCWPPGPGRPVPASTTRPRSGR